MRYVKSLICNLICGLLIFTLSTPSVAQEEPGETDLKEWSDFPSEDLPKPMLRLPAGEITTIGKVSYTCFNVKEYKDLLLLANDYQALYDWKLKTQAIARTWQDLDKVYNERINNVKDQIQLLRMDREGLLKKITEQDKYILNLQRQKDINVLGWKVVAGLELLGILALSITSAVQR